jgi:hydrogenase nickel incorporation protein HypB
MNPSTISIGRDVQAGSRQAAADLRARLTENGTLVVNLLSSPGSGKTTLLEATARYWSGKHRMGVLVGDIATDRDARRLAPLVPVVQLSTGGACHLELTLVQRGLAALGADSLDFLFIENVGNLVCPASHDLGEHLRVVVLSVTEGDDKPAKYPKAFRTSQALIINKTDLVPYVPFSIDAAIEEARIIQPDLATFGACAIRGEGIAEWCAFLELQRSARIAERDAERSRC